MPLSLHSLPARNRIRPRLNRAGLLIDRCLIAVMTTTSATGELPAQCDGRGAFGPEVAAADDLRRRLRSSSGVEGRLGRKRQRMVAHFMYRLDHVHGKFGAMFDKVGLKLKPSDYVRRNVWVTFQDDMIGPMTYRYFGEDNYMWASDFPHADSTWPDSLKVIAKDFEGIPDVVTRKMVADNAAKLYRMELN